MNKGVLKNVVYLTSGFTVVNLSLINFALGIYKDYPKSIFDNYQFQIGLIGLIMCLPIIATFAYSFSRVNSKKNRSSKNENRIYFLLILCFSVVIANIVFIYFLLEPFRMHLGKVNIGYNIIFLGGLSVSILVILLFNILLRTEE